MSVGLKRSLKRAKRSAAKQPILRHLQAYRNGRLARSPFFRAHPAVLDESLIQSKTHLSPECRYLYARIPKAANTTVTSSLMLGHGLDAENVDAVEQFKKGGAKLSEMSAGDVADIASGFFKFTMVRNPYSRILSAYLDKVCRRKGEAAYVIGFLGAGSSEEISFGQFLDYLEHGEGWRDDGHWARQSELLCLPAKRMDFIAKLESIHEDLPAILEQVFGTPGEIRTLSPHATDAARALDGCSGAELKRVKRLYEMDFDNFRYPSAIPA